MNPIALALLAAVAASAAPGARQSDSQIWTNGAATVKLSDHWRLSEEGHLRFSDNRNGLYEIEVEHAARLPPEQGRDGAGPATRTTRNMPHGDFTVMEHRAREQVTFDGFAKLGSGQAQRPCPARAALARHVDGTGWRVRPYLKYSLPIAGKTALNLSSEPFFNLNTTPFQRRTGLDRMRNLITISTPLTKAYPARWAT